MRDQLIIRLTENAPEKVSWVRLTETNPKPAIEYGQLEDAANVMAGAHVVVLIPASDVLLSVVNVPTQNKQRLLKALPYAMEEELATDVEQLHFSMGKPESDGEINVAIVDRDLMDHWQSLLKEAGITPDILTTELVIVPSEANAWSLVLADKYAYLRGSEIQDLVVDINNLSIMFPVWLKEQAEQLPEVIRVWRDASNNGEIAALNTAVNALEGTELTLDSDFVGNILDNGLMSLANGNLDLNNSINLLQGDYSRREQLGKIWRPWRYAAALAGVLFVLQLGLSISESSKLEAQHDRLKAEAIAIYKDTFPDSKRIVNVKTQMKQKLAELKGSGTVEKVDLLNLLADSGMAFKQTSGLVLKSIRYKKGTLDVEIEVPSLQVLDQLKQKLSQKKGFQVEIQSAASRNNIVQGRLQIKGAAS